MGPASFKNALVAALRESMASGSRPRLPAGGDLVWRWFCDLNAARAQGFSGPLPIGYAEISAYRQLTGWPIEARHIELIKALDSAYLDKSYGPALTGKPPNRKALTPAAFDAMFK